MKQKLWHRSLRRQTEGKKYKTKHKIQRNIILYTQEFLKIMKLEYIQRF